MCIRDRACLPDDMRAAQWVAHAGLDPRPYESGTSMNRPRRITKAGNRYLRDALYMPALVASQKDPHVSAYYNALLNRGKKTHAGYCSGNAKAPDLYLGYV